MISERHWTCKKGGAFSLQARRKAGVAISNRLLRCFAPRSYNAEDSGLAYGVLNVRELY